MAILRDWNDTRSDLDEDFLRHAETDATGTGTPYPKKRPDLRKTHPIRRKCFFGESEVCAGCINPLCEYGDNEPFNDDDIQW